MHIDIRCLIKLGKAGCSETGEMIFFLEISGLGNQLNVSGKLNYIAI